MPERWRRAFLATVPVCIALLLTVGWKLSREPEKVPIQYNHLDRDVTWARELYRQGKEAKLAAEADGPDATAKLALAISSCEDGLAILNKVRDDAGDPEPGQEFPFERDYQELTKLLILCRKNPHAVDAVRLKKPR